MENINEWLKGLLEYAQRAEESIKNDDIPLDMEMIVELNQLFGYIGSAKTMIELE